MLQSGGKDLATVLTVTWPRSTAGRMAAAGSVTHQKGEAPDPEAGFDRLSGDVAISNLAPCV